jgi:hypothetical protein
VHPGVMLESVLLGPPNLFARDENSVVRITATAHAEISGVVEKTDLSRLFTTLAAALDPLTESKTISQSILLSLTAVAAGGSIGDFTIQSIEPLRMIS